MQDYIIPILTLLAGGGLGWVFTISASRKKADGEAKQVEADAFKSAQDVYQQTIDDLNKYCNSLRADRDSLRADRDEMRQRNKELEEKIETLQAEILDLKKDVARFGRRIDAMRPFVCAKINCEKKTSVNFSEEEEETC